jgi:MoaA/NifB/PqqE/SkfB family radical SAM enzyme
MRQMERQLKDVVNLYLLTDCDMTCKFCYASKGKSRMTLDRARWFIDALRSRGGTRINITGGEPLLHPEATDIVEHASRQGLAVALFTSGSRYGDEEIARFSPHIRWLALSLDGDPQTNLAMGRSREHFDGVMNALSKTRSQAPQVSVRVATVVTSLNVHRLEELGTCLDVPSVRPDLWRIKQMVPTRRAGRHYDSLAARDHDFARMAALVQNRFGSTMRIDVISLSEKVSDTICVHPDGEATVTVGSGRSMSIHPLGNVFEDFDAVVATWDGLKDARNSREYGMQWTPA